MKPQHKATIITIIEMTIYVAIIVWLQWLGVGILLLYWAAFGLWALYKNKETYLMIKHYI